MNVVPFSSQKHIVLWEDYIFAHPDGTNYHQLGWRRVIEKSFGHKTRYLLALEEDQVIGVLPLALMRSRLFGTSVISLPFLNYGGLLSSSLEAKRALIDVACQFAKEEGAAYLELRHGNAHGLGLRPKQHKVAMLLPLASDTETAWKQFDAKVRNQVRKAQKVGLTIHIGGMEFLSAFYDIFSRNMRDLGTPVYGQIFFESILRVFPLHTRIFVVKSEGKPVAAGLSTIFKDTIEVPWAGSLVESRPLCPNMLLYWEAIQYGIQQGMKVFDFGRSTPGEGTYRFKVQWGAQAYPLYWEYWTRGGGDLPNISPTNTKFSLAIKIWKKLPLTVANLIGPPIVRCIP